MQEICSSNPPVVAGICDPNKSRVWHHDSLTPFNFADMHFLTKIKTLQVNKSRILWLAENSNSQEAIFT